MKAWRMIILFWHDLLYISVISCSCRITAIPTPHPQGFSGGVSIIFFFGGGEQEIFQWGQDPQKVISFDHFVPENVHFSWFHSNVGGQTGGRGQDIFWGGYLPPRPALPWCQHCMACIYETGTSGWYVRIPGLKSGQDMISWLFFVFNFFYLFIHSSLPGHRQLIMWWFINIWSIATLKMDVITGCK